MPPVAWRARARQSQMWTFLIKEAFNVPWSCRYSRYRDTQARTHSTAHKWKCAHTHSTLCFHAVTLHTQTSLLPSHTHIHTWHIHSHIWPWRFSVGTPAALPEVRTVWSFEHFECCSVPIKTESQHRQIADSATSSTPPIMSLCGGSQNHYLTKNNFQQPFETSVTWQKKRKINVSMNNRFRLFTALHIIFFYCTLLVLQSSLFFA